MIEGKKRWFLYPPNIVPPGVEYDERDKDYEAPDPLEWMTEVYPFLPSNQKPIECVQEKGEIIFVPSLWFHQVLNITTTIAVTQNFCNSFNFLNVWPEVCLEPDMLEEMLELHSTSRPELFTPDVYKMAGKPFPLPTKESKEDNEEI